MHLTELTNNNVTMALVTDVLIVEVIEEVIIIFVLKGNQTVPNILPLKPGLALSWPGLAICTEHKQNATSKTAGGN